MQFIRTPLQKGAVLGGGLAFGSFGLFFMGALLLEMLDKFGTDSFEFSPWSVLYVVVPVVTGLLAGAFWGHMAGQVAEQTNSRRYLKVLGYGLIAYVLAAFLVGTALVVGTAISEGQGNPDGSLLGDSIQLGFMGALLLSPLFLPVVAVLTYIMERWTRA